jgi:Animal haem peroxidase
MSNLGHGSVGTREQDFTQLLPLKTTDYPACHLRELSIKMKGGLDTVKDGADPEENLLLPAGYTYFGQFIDHDLTFDNTSSLNPKDTKDPAGGTLIPTNLRTPRFDLDSLYGDGPDAHPFMYAEDGASLLFKDSFANQSQTSYDQAHQDLLRSPNGRAIIGDKRNDENSIVSQIHLAFVRYHNAVVKHLNRADRSLTGTALFDKARNEVRWTYQKLAIEDFLPRIVKKEVLADLQAAATPDARKHLYALYDTPAKRGNLPREFVVAAYRFGHSGVRTGYRLNRGKRLSIFPSSKLREPDAPPSDSLLGFDPLPKDHVIDDWGRFFPNSTPAHPACTLGDEANGEVENPNVRLQFAYKIDCTLVDPLGVLPPQTLPTSNKVGGVLKEVQDAISPKPIPEPSDRPSLALLNLLRGNNYRVQGGQAIAKVLKDKGYHHAHPLEQKYLVTRQPGKKEKFFKFEPIPVELQPDTPLWFYILAEAQKSIVDTIAPKLDADGEFNEKILLTEANKTQLGWVGGRIVAEVFYGLMDADRESYLNAAPANWQPILGGNGDAIFLNLIELIR